MIPADLKTTMLEAADILESEAHMLRECHSNSQGRQFIDDADVRARHDHDHMVDVARRLREGANA